MMNTFKRHAHRVRTEKPGKGDLGICHPDECLARSPKAPLPLTSLI